MLNIFQYRPTIVIARQSIAFEDCGINRDNTARIVKIADPFQSYYPDQNTNAISGFEKDHAYFFFAKQNIDLTGIADNTIPADLSIQAGTNVFAGKAFAGIALQTIDFATVGFDSSNLKYIYKVGDPYQSYFPDKPFSAITGFEEGEPYYGLALADMDLSAYLIPPIVVPGDITNDTSPYKYYGTEATTQKDYYNVPVRFFADEASLPTTGTENIVYVAKAENTSFYWDGATYQQIGGGGTTYTDEQAQDAVGTILTDSYTVDFTYNDAANSIAADVKKQMSIASDASGLKLSGDAATPGNSKYYGTNGSGTKGFYSLPSPGITSETDPTVDTIIKNIPVSADATTNKYLNWNGSAYTRKQIDYSEIAGTIPGVGNSGSAVYTSANYTIAAGITHVITEPVSGLTVTVPAASSNSARVIWITNQGIANTTLSVGVKYNASSTANLLPPGVAWAIISDGTDWWRLTAAEQYSVFDAAITGLSLVATGGHSSASGTRNTTLRSIKAGPGTTVTLSTNDIVVSTAGVATKTAAYTATTSDFTLTGDASAGAFSITLPTAIGNTGKIFTIKKTDSSANTLTVATTSSQTIDGAASYSLSAQWKYVVVQSNGTNWIIIGNN